MGQAAQRYAQAPNGWLIPTGSSTARWAIVSRADGSERWDLLALYDDDTIGTQELRRFTVAGRTLSTAPVLAVEFPQERGADRV